MKFTRKEIDAVLKELRINPKDTGVLQIILNVGNSEYYKHRAIEFIHEGRIITACQLLVIMEVMKRRIKEEEPDIYDAVAEFRRKNEKT